MSPSPHVIKAYAFDSDERHGRKSDVVLPPEANLDRLEPRKSASVYLSSSKSLPGRISNQSPNLAGHVL